MLNMLEFQVEVNPIYGRLKTIFESMTEKPNESSRLFALVLDILISIFSCKITTEEMLWPIEAEYNGQAYDLLYTETKIDQTVCAKEQYIQ